MRKLGPEKLVMARYSVRNNLEDPPSVILIYLFWISKKNYDEACLLLQWYLFQMLYESARVGHQLCCINRDHYVSIWILTTHHLSSLKQECMYWFSGERGEKAERMMGGLADIISTASSNWSNICLLYD